ncbi:hypothetical protein CC1G_12677 [Coprinopsis cinerea okayama7|uniref:Uncharacterized protein n=1 Tax=Coprinopsis cinerea (strain Okayama-7 / 130 / ATCC MYA-4618 / FGSC 9003) TaxID=240176 RepID=A8PHM7_COPC7|nr:hypothetical protein CC1G_12677 [Coprinopsis cinerea okayama7\|eukprot:XP_001841437.2 hypothetical protein CC1G_12677 [Coprinopsis cinerea okayama7\
MLPSMEDGTIDLNVFRSRYDLPPVYEATLDYAFYALHVLHRLFEPQHKIPWMDIPIRVKSELHQLAFVVYQAIRRKIHLQWSIEDYAKVLHDEDLTEGEQMVRFPPDSGTSDGTSDRLDIEHEPCVFVDKNGRILWWYLPAIIRESRWMEFCNTVVSASALTHPPFGRPPAMPRSQYQTLFREGSQFARGAARFSPAHFEASSSVSPDIPYPSLPFRVDERFQGFAILDAIGSETMAIIGAVLALTQPVLFHVSLEMLERMADGVVTVGQPWVFHEVLRKWTSPFQTFTIYNNFSRPPHRFSDTHPMASDILLSAGAGECHRFTCPTLGREFHFDPGTICAGLTHLVCHGWAAAGNSDHLVCQFSVCEDLIQYVSPHRPIFPFTEDELGGYFHYLFEPPLDAGSDLHLAA